MKQHVWYDKVVYWLQFRGVWGILQDYRWSDTASVRLINGHEVFFWWFMCDWRVFARRSRENSTNKEKFREFQWNTGPVWFFCRILFDLTSCDLNLFLGMYFIYAWGSWCCQWSIQSSAFIEVMHIDWSQANYFTSNALVNEQSFHTTRNRKLFQSSLDEIFAKTINFPSSAHIFFE